LQFLGQLFFCGLLRPRRQRPLLMRPRNCYHYVIMQTEFDITSLRGLTEAECALRLKKDGPNELPSQKQQSFLVILWHVVCEPMLLLLIVCGLVYFALGEVKDALMLVSFVLVIIGITFYQERKTERALEALRNLSSPRALVVRDGRQKRIAGREVVCGDVIILREGDRVPADAEMFFSGNLLIDESLLTGESLPVGKDEKDRVFSGTLVVAGHGAAKVFAIGAKTEMGKIGKALQTIKEEEPLLKQETARLVRNFAIGGVGLCVLVVIVFGLTRGHWLNGFLAGLSLSMAVLPEEFSVVLLIFLSLGAWRMSKRQVLTRRTAAIETLGGATVLCVDKTGTLTMNKLTLDQLYVFGPNADYFSAGNSAQLPEKFHNLLEYACLASQKDPFDPLEREIRSAIGQFLINTEHVHDNWTLVREYPFSKELMALSHVWESADKQDYVIAAKGAPEAIFDLCHLNPDEKQKLLEKVHGMARDGLRLIGVARATFDKTNLPEGQHDFDFKFIGILGFVDPVREGVPAALQECYSAGIRVIMITGDYPGTAQHIARQINLQNPDEFIAGAELLQMDSQVLRQRIQQTNIFARVVPEQKLAIINALKANGEVVAMTGDGVNDAPALKSANIGVAMGERGTDVARESAGLVLLNDDFSSIVEAVKMGRRIFDNLKKAIAYIASVHIPIAGMVFLPVLFKFPLVLLPAHIAFLELIIDPACSTVFEAEPEEKNVMRRPPRNLKTPLFDRGSFWLSMLQGLSVLIIVFVVFLAALWRGKGETDARTITFATLVVTNLALIVANLSPDRSWWKTLVANNIALRCVLLGASVCLFLVLYVPFFSSLFHFSILHLDDLLVAMGVGLLCLFWFEWTKKKLAGSSHSCIL